MLPILNRTQETLFLAEIHLRSFFSVCDVLHIPHSSEAFEMFFRDVDNQFLDEVQSRNSFSNSFVVFVSGVHFILTLRKDGPMDMRFHFSMAMNTRNKLTGHIERTKLVVFVSTGRAKTAFGEREQI